MFLLRPLCASLATLSLLASAIAQAGDSAELLIQPVASQFPNLVVDVNVRDARTGAPIAGLSAANFKATEDLRDLTISGIESLAQDAADSRNVDFVFVFDDTGSMAEEIDGLIQRTLEFANIVQSSGFDYRFALVSFGDELRHKVDFTRSASDFKAAVSALHANGGDDEPENALEALHYAATALSHDPARRKVFILITDASYHSANHITPLTSQAVLAELHELGTVLNIVGPNLDQYRWMASNLAGSFYDKDSGQFKRIIEQIAGGSASNYRLTLTSSRPEYDNSWRALEVSLQGEHSGSGVSQYQAPSWVSASSRVDGFSGIDSQFAPHNVIDGNPSTSWAEGVSGAGNGEWLALDFPTAQRVDRFTLAQKADSGIRRVSVVINGEDKRFYDLQPGSQAQSFALEAPLQVSRFQVILEEASSGDNGLAEIGLFNGDSLVEPIARAHDIRRTARLAEEQNRKGEELYHARQYEDAVFYYKEAIKNDPAYAQAFSNLGLAYQRQNRLADAIWANRQAIALARGATRNTVLASSHYNIARIFETQNKFEQALQNFLWAENFKSNPVYAKAIARMNEKLGR